MLKLDIEELREFVWPWFVEGTKDRTLTPEQTLFLYDILVVLNKIKQHNIDIIVNDETMRNVYKESVEQNNESNRRIKIYESLRNYPKL